MVEVIDTMSNMNRQDLINLCAINNPEAAEFLDRVISAAHTWDDLIDRDKDVSDEEINSAFFTAFVWLPSSRFYITYFNDLYPILVAAVNNWMAATSMEREPKNPVDTEISFIIRSDYMNLAIAVARICGGHDYALQITPDVRRIWHSEGYTSYLNELALEASFRKGEQHVRTKQ